MGHLIPLAHAYYIRSRDRYTCPEGQSPRTTTPLALSLLDGVQQCSTAQGPCSAVLRRAEKVHTVFSMVVLFLYAQKCVLSQNKKRELFFFRSVRKKILMDDRSYDNSIFCFVGGNKSRSSTSNVTNDGRHIRTYSNNHTCTCQKSRPIRCRAPHRPGLMHTWPSPVRTQRCLFPLAPARLEPD